MLTNTIRCLQIPLDAYKYREMLTNTERYSQILTGTYKQRQILTDTQDDQENEVHHQLSERGPHHDLPVVRVCHLARGPHACKPRWWVQFSSWTYFFLFLSFFYLVRRFVLWNPVTWLFLNQMFFLPFQWWLNKTHIITFYAGRKLKLNFTLWLKNTACYLSMLKYAIN